MERNDKQEIIEAIQGAEKRLETKLLGALEGVEQTLTEQIGMMADEVHGVDIRLKRVEALMVTKDYLDKKLAGQHSDIIKQVQEHVPVWK